MTDNTLTIKETYYPDSTQVKSRIYYNAQDQLHNPHGPAVQFWYSDGQLSGRGFYLNGEELVEVKNISKIAGVEYTARN